MIIRRGEEIGHLRGEAISGDSRLNHNDLELNGGT
jgi:hypothetical protein